MRSWNTARLDTYSKQLLNADFRVEHGRNLKPHLKPPCQQRQSVHKRCVHVCRQLLARKSPRWSWSYGDSISVQFELQFAIICLESSTSASPVAVGHAAVGHGPHAAELVDDVHRQLAAGA